MIDLSGNSPIFSAKVQIDLLTALSGGIVDLVHLDGRIIRITILPGELIKPDQLKQVTGEGMPTYKRPYDKGHPFCSI